MTGVGGASLDWDRRRRVTPVQTASHMWTAPGLQDLAQRTDRSDCDHMSGLLSRSHMTAAKMGSATRVPNRKATFEEEATGTLGVSRVLGSIDHAICSVSSKLRPQRQGARAPAGEDVMRRS